MISSKDILDIFESPEFANELEELSSFAAHIKQERPIVLLFAKYFWRKKHEVILELKKCDLVVDGIKIEFKYHFDCDTTQRVEKELTKSKGDLGILIGAKPTGWKVCANIYKDIVDKNPDIFVWIICSRDLSMLNDENLSKVVWSSQQNKYNEQYPYDPIGKNLSIMRGFLESLMKVRPFSLRTVSVQTNQDFPSAYYLFVCEFANRHTPR